MTDNNIQKLYKVAGVEKLVEQWYRGSIYGTTENCIEMAHKWSKENGIKIKNLTVLNDEDICFDKVYHPPFTAEKQLELIKLVSNFKVYETVKHKGGKWFMCASIGCNNYCEARDDHFDQALAGLILQLWDELSSEQREEVRGILQ